MAIAGARAGGDADIAVALTASDADAARWDRFVRESPQGTVFSTTPFLKALDVPYDLWLAGDADSGLGLVVLKDAAGRPLQAPAAFALYQGPMFGSRHATLSPHRRIARGLDLLSTLLAALERRYDRISFATHYDFEDMRALSWFHYHQPDAGLFRIELFYTGVVDLVAWPTFDAYLGAVRPLRRRERLKAVSSGLRIEASSDLELLSTLYCATFARQGLQVDEETRQLLRRIAAASLAGGWGELLVCRSHDGAPVSATLFLHDARSAYYLVGANDPAHRASGAATALMLENIERCFTSGRQRVDMLGINSPQRGDFKTSFNAQPRPYFVLTWNRQGEVK